MTKLERARLKQARNKLKLDAMWHYITIVSDMVESATSLDQLKLGFTDEYQEHLDLMSECTYTTDIKSTREWINDRWSSHGATIH